MEPRGREVPAWARAAQALALLVASAATLTACGDDYLSRAEMMDPETCRDCHPKHFEEWQSSMHAYAADDPIFLAMNRRGQRETNGALGDFCVQCHAPMAVREGATTDGLNLEELPQHLKGVTCYFCHTVVDVTDTHNNPLVLSGGTTMLGGIADAIENGVHRTKYSSLHDRNNSESSAMCGSCHDIVTDNIHLERTFAEYKESIFVEQPFDQTCSNCHMDGSDDVVADFEGVPTRKRHSHAFPGVDLAITDWPGIDTQRELILGELRTSVQSRLCYNPATNSMDLNLTNVAGGHMFPSGATQDRQVWVELVAKVGDTEVLKSGVFADDEAVSNEGDALLWQMKDFGFNAEGDVEHMFWNIVRLEGELLPPSVTLDMTDPRYDHSITRSYPLGANPRPDEVDVVVRIRAVMREVIEELIASGDLDEQFRNSIETMDLEGSRLHWTPEAAGSDLCVP